jgi:hypothetical protein
MPVADLPAVIASAFATAPHPGDDALVIGAVDYDPEYREVANAFARKHWRELSPAFVHEHRDALPLLTPAAFRFFLPAYLLACLEAEQDLDTAPLNVALSLTPPAGETAAFAARTAAFTAAEASAICAYLEAAQHLEGLPGGSVALALRYWRSRFAAR